MKNLREYILNENNFFKNLGIGQVGLIRKWLDEHDVKNYTINNDFTIDVNGGLFIYKYEETQLPDYIKFNKVKGELRIDWCFGLNSL
jgi:hypothetical protein